jgi:hypothetical protein
MSGDPFSQMRRGDRSALRGLLRTYGQALHALRKSLNPESSSEALAIAVWRSSLSALRGVDPRSHTLAAAACFLAAEDRSEGPVPEVDRSAFVFAVSYDYLGAGSGREGRFVERALQAEPELEVIQARVQRALELALNAPVEDDVGFDPLWSTIEAQLD